MKCRKLRNAFKVENNEERRAHPWHHRGWPCIYKQVLPIYQRCASECCVFELEIWFLFRKHSVRLATIRNIVTNRIVTHYYYYYKTRENGQDSLIAFSQMHTTPCKIENVKIPGYILYRSHAMMRSYMMRLDIRGVGCNHWHGNPFNVSAARSGCADISRFALITKSGLLKKRPTRFIYSIVY